LAGFERPEFTRKLFRKGRLAPKLKDMLTDLEDLDTRISRLESNEEENKGDRGITDVNPLGELRQRRDALDLEYNDLANEFNDSAVEFTFRVPDKKSDRDRISALMDADGITEPSKPDVDGLDEDQKAAALAEFDVAFSAWWDALMIRSMSVTCQSHSLTVAQWEALRDATGLGAFNLLAEAWAEAVQAAAPTSAPFSPRRSVSNPDLASSVG
jgi:hypothetical protein